MNMLAKPQPVCRNPEIPEEVLQSIRVFLLDKKTGNIVVNCKDGRVLGYRLEEIRSIRS